MPDDVTPRPKLSMVRPPEPAGPPPVPDHTSILLYAREGTPRILGCYGPTCTMTDMLMAARWLEAYADRWTADNRSFAIPGSYSHQGGEFKGGDMVFLAEFKGDQGSYNFYVHSFHPYQAVEGARYLRSRCDLNTIQEAVSMVLQAQAMAMSRHVPGGGNGHGG